MSKHEETNNTVIAHEEVPLEWIEDEQLGHAERQQVNTQAFRKFSISTTITDLRQCFFVDSTQGKQREACICFFQIEFGNQKRDSRQRISDVSIDVLFNDSDDDSYQSPSTTDDLELLCKAIYPREAHGVVDKQSVSRRIAADIRPIYMDASLGGVTLDKTIRQERKGMMEFRASSAGDMGYRVLLTENITDRTGVPQILRFAVLVKTDGLPFEIELKFVGNVPSFLGPKLGGCVSLKIGKKHLWLRSKTDEGTIHCQDADSDGFVNWVKSKTQNQWAETAEYDIE